MESGLMWGNKKESGIWYVRNKEVKRLIVKWQWIYLAWGKLRFRLVW